MYHVLIADDHAVVRSGLAYLILTNNPILRSLMKLQTERQPTCALNRVT
ncbi:response regulator [Lactiplantibacillus plantarum]|uniref:Response regulator n=1 Tax=Lactiplantibacillus plantarum TaxID=1590 RepID=A0A165QY70_LACPN|nr:response regulator [Lactiplantibacillus plantarum]